MIANRAVPAIFEGVGHSGVGRHRVFGIVGRLIAVAVVHHIARNVILNATTSELVVGVDGVTQVALGDTAAASNVGSASQVSPCVDGVRLAPAVRGGADCLRLRDAVPYSTSHLMST